MKNLTVIPQSISRRPHQSSERTAKVGGKKSTMDVADWDFFCNVFEWLWGYRTRLQLSGYSALLFQRCQIITPQRDEAGRQVPEACGLWHMSYPLLAHRAWPVRGNHVVLFKL